MKNRSWLTYVRRADSRYVCLLNEYCEEGLFDDGGYNEYTAHTYYIYRAREPLPMKSVVG